MAKKPSQLSEQAKAEARKLVQKWDARQLNPYALFQSYPVRTGSADLITLSRQGVLANSGFPKAGILFELKQCDLISIRQHYSADGRTVRVEIQLLEALREAVRSNFQEPTGIQVEQLTHQEVRLRMRELRDLLSSLGVLDDELQRRFIAYERTPTAENLAELLPLTAYKVMALFSNRAGGEAAALQLVNMVQQLLERY